ncbi:MAG TPA: DUF2914 domain-containing protein [Balneolaceae bacterium]
MRRFISVICFILFFGLNNLSAQHIKVSNIQVATSIENRQPMGVDTSFAANVGRVFCFTRIKGATDTTQIAQVWYYKDQEKARIELDVRSNNWRTWSSKAILESWTGPWRVMVIDSNGNVLATTSFKIGGEQ